MDLSTLKSAPGARKRTKRVGRGPSSGHGKTCGRGHKGQRSRSGHNFRFAFEGGQMPLQRRLPKRGFFHEDRWPEAVVNVDALCQAFEDGDEVTAEDMVRRGVAKSSRGGVKVLGRGEVTKQLKLTVQSISPSARAKIEAAGGSVELIGYAAQQGEQGQKEE